MKTLEKLVLVFALASLAFPIVGQTAAPASRPAEVTVGTDVFRDTHVVEFRYQPALMNWDSEKAKAYAAAFSPSQARFDVPPGWKLSHTLEYAEVVAPATRPTNASRPGESEDTWRRGRFVSTVEIRKADAPREAGGATGVAGFPMGVRETLAETAHHMALGEIESFLGKSVKVDMAADLTAKRAELENKRKEVELKRQASEKHLQEEIALLRRQMRELKMEENGKRARLEAIRIEVARIGAEAEARAAKDPVLKELETVLKLRTTDLERADKVYESGHATDSEVADFQARVSEAHIQLLQRREALAESAGGGVLAELNKAQTMLAIDLAELEARWRFLMEATSDVEAEPQGWAGREKRLTKEIDALTPYRIDR